VAEPFLPSSGYSKPVLIEIQLFNASNLTSGGGAVPTKLQLFNTSNPASGAP
jgi:hypothetical protein